jgi:hypothetical protein
METEGVELLLVMLAAMQLALLATAVRPLLRLLRAAMPAAMQEMLVSRAAMQLARRQLKQAAMREKQLRGQPLQPKPDPVPTTFSMG